jgi:beta-glucosidase-like glycosyl hydrolase/CubicO group peptidase (beta-lactamase class C family)
MNTYNNRSAYFAISIFLFISILTSSSGPAFEEENLRNENPITGFNSPWVDSVIQSLTLEQRIAQLLMIEVSSNQNRTYNNRIERIIKNYGVGGLIFFKGGPTSQVNLTNHWQRVSQTPMFIAMDAEWGLSMRLDSTPTFPRQLTLGAIANERLIYELGLEMGRQARRMGVHMTFSPVVDVNSNPNNPVINSRSFGECRYNVTRKGMAMMFGLQDAGIIATAKHFPGHGDTDVDSHHVLPLINHPFEKLDSLHLFPYKHLIDKGLKAIMIAHLNVPALGPSEELPSSLSKEIVTDLLQNQLGFKGLIITDALNMKGVSAGYSSGQSEVMALMAGNDILLMPENVPQAINAIKDAITEGLITEDYLNQKVKKILYFKEQSGLNNLRMLSTSNLHADINSAKSQSINKKLAESSITVLKNDEDILPLKNLEKHSIAALTIGSSEDNPFQAMLSNYAPVSMYSISKNHNAQQVENLIKQLSNHNLIIISVQNNSMWPGRNYGINDQTIDLINHLSETNNVILNIFASPYSLSSFGNKLLNAKGIIVSYQDGREFEEASAQIIFGALPARGKLPVSVIPFYSIYAGENTPGGLRIKYSFEDHEGINQTMLGLVDSMALAGIEIMAYPGCQIAVVKDGTMVYNKSFGYHTYDKKQPVTNNDIYDIASLTKIVATTSAIMRLVDEEKIDVDNPIGYYLSMLSGSNKEDLILRDILAHQARLRSWIPFFINTLRDGKPSDTIYSTRKSDDFPIEVAEDLYIHRTYRDSILKTIVDSDLLNRKRYIYSDLGFILFKEMIEEITKIPFENYLQNTFYSPLGLKNLGFNPLLRISEDRIIPTELDTLFRRQLIKGHVHDPGAAMLGGIAGHAGLFSNAEELAVFMQMLLSDGSYGGMNYIKPETIKEFTTTQFAGNRNRRGLGFDKPSITKSDDSHPSCESASYRSFGHSGFTGTYVWADPQEDLVYVFLSNRVHPDASNRRISELDIRTQIHQAIYNAIFYDRFVENSRLP